MNAFPGYPVYLETAAAAIGHPEAAGPARRISLLAAIANLCAQAHQARAQDVPGILAKATEFRDQLRAAWYAAELMLADVPNPSASTGPGPGAIALPALPERPETEAAREEQADADPQPASVPKPAARPNVSSQKPLRSSRERPLR